MPKPLYTSGQEYDRMFPTQDDLPFWLAQAARYGGPILELGCGTGRVSIPLAQAGHQVVGIDRAQGMLAEAERKAAQAGCQVRWQHADICDFDLNETFSLVIFPANAICHLLTWRALEACLTCVKRHLRPDGRLIVAVFVPNLDILRRDPLGIHLFAEYANPNEQDPVLITHSNRYLADTQINQIALLHSHSADLREISAEVIDTVAMRMYFPQELEALLHYNGLMVEHKYGDFDMRPFDSSSPQQLVVCRRT